MPFIQPRLRSFENSSLSLSPSLQTQTHTQTFTNHRLPMFTLFNLTPSSASSWPLPVQCSCFNGSNHFISARRRPSYLSAISIETRPPRWRHQSPLQNGNVGFPSRPCRASLPLQISTHSAYNAKTLVHGNVMRIRDLLHKSTNEHTNRTALYLFLSALLRSIARTMVQDELWGRALACVHNYRTEHKSIYDPCVHQMPGRPQNLSSRI